MATFFTLLVSNAASGAAPTHASKELRAGRCIINFNLLNASFNQYHQGKNQKKKTRRPSHGWNREETRNCHISRGIRQRETAPRMASSWSEWRHVMTMSLTATMPKWTMDVFCARMHSHLDVGSVGILSCRDSQSLQVVMCYIHKMTRGVCLQYHFKMAEHVPKQYTPRSFNWERMHRPRGYHENPRNLNTMP